ncbi:hypothetical protein ABT369_26130 [Dactylosporangium sp. NPDC000244]|uniref:hypothetical protein n=1 Tax=Dactylosporangium sp. NPDC000244 TaxID=3154365 RepID=UPI003323A65E
MTDREPEEPSPWARPAEPSPFDAPSPWSSPPRWAEPEAAPISPAPHIPEAPDIPEALDVPEAADIPPAPVRARRRPAALIAAGVVLAVAVAAVAGFVVLRPSANKSPSDAIAGAVAAIAASGGTTAALTFGDRNGTLVDAEFTVTAAGLGTGVVTDPGGGRAEVRTNGTRTVVRADADWWSRRAPGQASALADKWILPRDGLILPIDITRALTPKGIAESVRFAASGHPKAAGTVPWPGGDADLLDNTGWLLLLTRAEPRSVVWFGGHLTGFGPLQPAALHRGGGAGPHFVPAHQPNNVPPYVGVTLSTPDGAALAKVAEQVGQVLPPPDRAAAADAPEPPLTQATVPLTAPRFVTQPDDEGCGGGQCAWTVKVTNTGTAPCDATLIATVNPGMEPRSTRLGVLAPGESRTTPSMTFREQAPRALYNAQVYCPALDGLDPAARQRVAALQLDPSQSPRVKELDPALQTVLLSAADAMVRGRPSLSPADRQRVLAALDLVIAGQLIPEVRMITGSGRVENPDALPEILRNASGAAPAADQLPFRRELELAANLLRNDPGARLRLDDRTPSLTDTASGKVYRLAAVTGDRLLPDRPAPAGKLVLMVYLEPTRPEHDLGRPGFVSLLREPRNRAAAADTLCPGGRPAVAELVLVNRHGEERWTAAQLHELADACP